MKILDETHRPAMTLPALVSKARRFARFLGHAPRFSTRPAHGAVGVCTHCGAWGTVNILGARGTLTGPLVLTRCDREENR